MLACEDLTVEPESGGERILDRASAGFGEGGLHAVIGPSGCGKTTLVTAMLGLVERTGTVTLDGDRVSAAEDLRGRVAFAPQFSLAHGRLTVEESLSYAFDLLVADARLKKERIAAILDRTGLRPHAGKRVADLSGGQTRRLGLGLELVGDPGYVVCDEVTTGLDPRSEEDILEVLRGLREEKGMTFLCIIHNLAKLAVFDRITVVHEGTVVFQGDLDSLKRYFGITDVLRLYDVLQERTAAEWRRLREASGGSEAEWPGAAETPAPAPGERPPALRQTATLLRRRLLLFQRDRGYWLLTLGITVGFPMIVAIFAFDGLPQLRGLAMESEAGFLERMEENLRYRIEALETASLVTGLILFQVILLTLMGSNNGAREIAGERALFEKERFAGLRPEAYALGKLIFTSLIAVGQGLWMTLFVKYVCDFPGPLAIQAGTLVLCCVSMTAVCLGFSAVFGSADRASLVSIYLVGFQLPLSGVVLALPELLVWVFRPFVTAYWGWAGYFSSMIETRLYDAYRLDAGEVIPQPWLAAVVLMLHFCAGAGLVFWGCQKKRWE